MKNLLFLFSFLISYNSFANQLTTFQKIHDSINEGNPLRVVVDFGKCETPIPGLIGQYAPNAIMVMDDLITFSDNHFTTNDPSYKNEPVNEYVNYKLTRTNKVTIVTKVVNLPTYKVNTLNSNLCELNTAIKFYN